MTVEVALTQWPDAEPVESSREVREDHPYTTTQVGVILAAISFSKKNAVRRSARCPRTANAPTAAIPQLASRVAAAAHEPTPSESSFELMRGLYVSEEFVDTIPSALVDDLLKD